MSENPYINVLRTLLSKTAETLLTGNNPYGYMRFILSFRRYSRSGSPEDTVRRLIVYYFNFGAGIEKVYFRSDDKFKDDAFLSRYDTAYRSVDEDGGIVALLEQTFGPDPQINEIESSLECKDFGHNMLREYVFAVDTIMKNKKK